MTFPSNLQNADNAVEHNVGRGLRQIQAELRVTNRKLAEQLGVTPVQVARWRSRRDMKLSRVVELANFFEISIDDFLNRCK